MKRVLGEVAGGSKCIHAWMHQWDASVNLSNLTQVTQKPKDFNFVLRGAAGDVGPHYARPRPASNTTQASQPKKCIPTPSKAEGEHPQLWQPKTSPRTAASPQKHPRTTATRAHHPRRRRPQPRLATRPRRPSKSRARPRGRALALLEAETNGVVRFKMRRVDGVLVG